MNCERLQGKRRSINTTSNLQPPSGLRPAEADHPLELVAGVAEELRLPEVAAAGPVTGFLSRPKYIFEMLTQTNN